MIRLIELEEKDITRELFSRAQFFSYAGSGAMGDAGAVIIVTDDAKAYYCNYVYGNVSADVITKAFPLWLKAPYRLPEDWIFYDLGMGNQLLVKKIYQAEFEELAGENISPVFLYQNWLKFAIDIISSKQ